MASSMTVLGVQRIKEHTWIAVFIAAFLGLLVDGMDLMFLSYSLTSLKNEFALTEVQAGALGSISLVGMALGGILGGWASDRYGRVRSLVWIIMLFSLGTASLGLTQSYTQFAVMRFISALGIGAEYVVANTLVAEYVPTKYRTTILGTLQAGWSVGYVVATLLARWIIPEFGWRLLFAPALVPVVLAVSIRFFIPESPSWLAAKARETEGKNKPSSLKEKGKWAELFSDPAQKKTFVLWAITTACLQFGYFGVNNWLPRYIEKEMGVDFKLMSGYLLGTYSAMILGKIIAGYLADIFGRRAIYAFGGFSAAVFLPIIVLYHTPENILWLLTIFGFLYGIPYGVNATYMTESFSTAVRGTAVGGAYNMGRVGAAFAPVAIGYIALHASIGFGFLIMGGAYLLCGLIPMLFIREKMYDPSK